jgi:cell division protein FtsQ
MWDNPRLLNLAANALFCLAIGLVLAGAFRALIHSPLFPLKTISVSGEMRHVTRTDIVGALQDRVSGTLFTADLDAIRAAFEAIPWIRRAEVRRVWPGEIEVRVEEYIPFARWGQEREAALVNVFGEVFAGRDDSALPLLSGPKGSEREVVGRYVEFQEALAPVGLELAALMLSSRRSWQMKLSDGLTVQLGRESDKDRIGERLLRFVQVYPLTLGKLGRKLDYVDLRYPNGFALRLPGGPKSETQAPRRT